MSYFQQLRILSEEIRNYIRSTRFLFISKEYTNQCDVFVRNVSIYILWRIDFRVWKVGIRKLYKIKVYYY